MLADELRECAKAEVSAFTPHWQDAAKRLMRQAADALDAADVALREYYECALARIAQFEHAAETLADAADRISDEAN